MSYTSFTVLTALLAVASMHATASPVEEQKSAQLRQQLRLQAEARVAAINQNALSWTAKLHPRFAELTHEEIQHQLLGLARDPAALVAKRQLALEDGLEKKKKKRTTTTRQPTTAASTWQPTTAASTWQPTNTTTTSTTTQAPSTTTEEPEEPSFDAREEWPECADVISKIQDQSGCGSCWAVSSASVMQDRICIETDGAKKVDISAKDLMACEPYSEGCNGGYPDKAFQFWESNGIVTGAEYGSKKGCKPYPFPPHAHKMYSTPKCNHHCDSWRNWFKYKKDKHFGQNPESLMDTQPGDIMDAILEGGPVVASMIVYDDFIHYSSGVYQHGPSAQQLGGHAVRVIGWGADEQSGKPYWLVANSWNTDWGMDGYFKIARGQDECWIESWGIDFAEPKV